MNKKDLILFASIILISSVLLLTSLFGREGSDVSIFVNGELYGKYDLSVPERLQIKNNGITDEIVIENGSVFIENATCPDKLCVHTGRINRNNESICCAPAGILIVVKSDEDSGYDAITK